MARTILLSLRWVRRHSVFVLALAYGLTSGAGAQTSTAHVRVGTPGQAGNAGVYFAQDQGFFKKYGLDAEITTLRRGSGAGVVAAVAGGSLDIGEADLMSLGAARTHGIKISALAPSSLWVSSAPTGALIVAKTSPLRAAKDFEGKTLGVPSLDGISRVTTSAWLDQNGADLSKIKFVEVPSGEMAASIARGTIDGATITEPTLTQALAQNNRVVAYVLDAVGPNFIQTCWFASDDWIATHPQQALAFARAIRDAQRWANANRAAATAIFAKYAGDPETPRIKATYGDVLDAAKIQPVLDVAYKYHAFGQPLPARDLMSPVVANL